MLSRNNNSTRYAANLQIAKTPDSAIALPATVASEKWIPWIPQKNPARHDHDLLTY
jgi:hypothetical protein